MPKGAVFIPGPSFAPAAESPLFGAIRTIEQWGTPKAPLPCKLSHNKSGIGVGTCRLMFLTELRTKHISAVIVGPDRKATDLVAFFDDLLSERPRSIGGALVWSHPAALQPDLSQ